jgi:putative ABC transport system substrate-binding protein
MLAFVLLVTPLAADAQPPRKVPRVGVLLSGSPERHALHIEAFQRGPHELGYVEGRNIALEYRFADGKFDRLSGLAAGLVGLPVDIIVAGGPALRAAKNATSAIPIIMVNVQNPVETGYVASLARPGGNITGLTQVTAELSGKRLELLKETVPGLSRVAVLWNAASAGMALSFGETQIAARALGVHLHPLQVRRPDDFDHAFEAAIKEQADALITFGDPLTNTHRSRIIDFAAQRRLPALYTNREFVDAGGLISYGPNTLDIYRRAAIYMDKILRGANPKDLPVEQPMKFELVINLRAAKALGLTISSTLLFQADEVIK